jgi:hypothetical protein
MLGLGLSGCAATSPDSSASEPPSSAEPAPDSPDTTGDLTPAEAEAVLRALYEPIHQFYEDMERDGGTTHPPEGLAHPDLLQTYLAQTMAPSVAASSVETLLMEQDGAWVVRPTELIPTPYMGSPALQDVRVEPADAPQTFALTKVYTMTELSGDFDGTNIVRYQEGQWRLMNIR